MRRRHAENVTAPSGFIASTTDAHFADFALIYTADWNSIKLSAAYTFTWIETGAVTGDEVNLHQVGASILHKPSGLGIYGMYQNEQTEGDVLAGLNPVKVGQGAPCDQVGPGPPASTLTALFSERVVVHPSSS